MRCLLASCSIDDDAICSKTTNPGAAGVLLPGVSRSDGVSGNWSGRSWSINAPDEESMRSTSCLVTE
jgi:hypothetical protein